MLPTSIMSFIDLWLDEMLTKFLLWLDRDRRKMAIELLAQHRAAMKSGHEEQSPYHPSNYLNNI